jgi:4-alpha-glucanotransferase
MTFDVRSRYRTGVLVPVAALRSEHNLGVGEFADIPALAQWCADTGLDLIQLLPVNDSGGESSPYSALSAFALHPISRTSMDRFIDDNRWVRSYSVFKCFKARNQERSWVEWPDMRDPAPSDIDAAWNDESLSPDIRFQVWLQLRLHEQFRSAALAAAGSGVMLKGDLPILMNDDSVDVWSQRDNFIMELRAGAPPDMFSHHGQNWGLPIYNWRAMSRDGYRWWKERLSQAAKFYSAYRIDHVLGFFRVWAIPSVNTSGLLGRFVPSESASRVRLHELGFDDGRIRWLAEPHQTGSDIRDTFGDQAPAVIEAALKRIGDEDLYVFSGSIRGETDIQALDLPVEVIGRLVDMFADRALLDIGNDRFVPAWNARSCSRFRKLADAEKASFEQLARELSETSEAIWEKQARELLGFMSTTTQMLTCAEDLGVIPRVVPSVLGDLGMLGLRIPRWSRLWDKPGKPFVPAGNYPYLTVCAPSVHDTSTMRAWWKEDAEETQLFWASLGLGGKVPKEYTTETARRVTGALLETGSAICVFQIQDILALAEAVPLPAATDERVNVPGTVNDFNWNYRMPVTLEEFSSWTALKQVLGPMVRSRAARHPKTEGDSA